MKKILIIAVALGVCLMMVPPLMAEEPATSVSKSSSDESAVEVTPGWHWGTIYYAYHQLGSSWTYGSFLGSPNMWIGSNDGTIEDHINLAAGNYPNRLVLYFLCSTCSFTYTALWRD